MEIEVIEGSGQSSSIQKGERPRFCPFLLLRSIIQNLSSSYTCYYKADARIVLWYCSLLCISCHDCHRVLSWHAVVPS